MKDLRLVQKILFYTVLCIFHGNLNITEKSGTGFRTADRKMFIHTQTNGIFLLSWYYLIDKQNLRNYQSRKELLMLAKDSFVGVKNGKININAAYQQKENIVLS